MLCIGDPERQVAELIQPLPGAIDTHCYKSYTT